MAWFDTYDDETKQYVAARGLDKKTEAEALQETIKAHRNAESRLGIPADRVLKLPEKADDPAWTDVYTKLGVPAQASEYDFSGVKHADGSALEEDLAIWLRSQAAENKLTKAAATALAAATVKRTDDLAVGKTQADRVAVALQQQELEKQWGAAFTTNKFVAERTAELLGLDKTVLNGLSNAASYPAVMDGLRKIGVAMGEGKLLGVNDGSGSPGSVVTPQEAADKLASLKKNPEWLGRWKKGDPACQEDIISLTKLSVGSRPQMR